MIFQLTPVSSGCMERIGVMGHSKAWGVMPHCVLQYITFPCCSFKILRSLINITLISSPLFFFSPITLIFDVFLVWRDYNYRYDCIMPRKSQNFSLFFFCLQGIKEGVAKIVPGFNSDLFLCGWGWLMNKTHWWAWEDVRCQYEVPSDRCSENREKERVARTTLIDSKTNLVTRGLKRCRK